MNTSGQFDHWFEGLADHMGSAYLRYAFTKHTTHEVDFVMGVLGIEPGSRVLDVGCGPGRHALELARRGVETVGVDISNRFVQLATEAAASEGLNGASFIRADARSLDFSEEFDAVISMCEGAFGLQGGPAAGDDPGGLQLDLAILEGMAAALRGGGRLGLAAFSAYFQLRHLDETNTFDAASGVHHEVTRVHDEHGRAVEADLWTTCFTPRELRLMASAVGLDGVDVFSVSSVDTYHARPPDLDQPEFFLVARKGGG